MGSLKYERRCLDSIYGTISDAKNFVLSCYSINGRETGRLDHYKVVQTLLPIAAAVATYILTKKIFLTLCVGVAAYYTLKLMRGVIEPKIAHVIGCLFGSTKKPTVENEVLYYGCQENDSEMLKIVVGSNTYYLGKSCLEGDLVKDSVLDQILMKEGGITEFYPPEEISATSLKVILNYIVKQGVLTKEDLKDLSADELIPLISNFDYFGFAGRQLAPLYDIVLDTMNKIKTVDDIDDMVQDLRLQSFVNYVACLNVIECVKESSCSGRVNFMTGIIEWKSHLDTTRKPLNIIVETPKSLLLVSEKSYVEPENNSEQFVKIEEANHLSVFAKQVLVVTQKIYFDNQLNVFSQGHNLENAVFAKYSGISKD